MTNSKAKENTVKVSNKKSKKELKLPETEKLERVASSKGRMTNSISPFLATFTPKNSSKEKKFKNIFLSSISHNLKTPLNSNLN